MKVVDGVTYVNLGVNYARAKVGVYVGIYFSEEIVALIKEWKCMCE